MGAKQYVSHIIMRPGLEFTEKWATFNTHLFFIKLDIFKYGLVETVAN